MKTLINELKKIEVLTREEELKLFEELRNGNEYAEELLVKHNLRLVAKIARRYSQVSGAEFEDLFSEGTIGLVKSIRKFDHHTGNRLCSYAEYVIRQSITHYLKNNNNLISIPEKKKVDLDRIKRVRSALLSQLNREPNFEEIAKELNMDGKKVEEILSYEAFFVNNEMENGEGEFISVFDTISSEENVEEMVEQKMLEEEVLSLKEEFLLTLKERERKIYRLRLQEEKSLEEVSEIIGISKEGVRKGAIRVEEKMRKYFLELKKCG
ncbi:sigma-70 family RNA polymerase sigma factor [Bacillus badius]|uniref:sigma-70 family RNA polymerase sigma factor n=1 Tax=Bacillus badius TaxID=1455 RepID=UPI0007B38742|nr:sigma-70 family RNA polymerase sigma factor [Bacillus badius]KZR59363.1 hypothetical protein A3781_13255 [Bacillus badius]